MRVALLNEGTYPLVRGGVSVWCDQLVRALSEIDFHLVTLTATGREPQAWELPPSVKSFRTVPLWGPPVDQRAAGRSLRRATLSAFFDLVRASAAPGGEEPAQAFRDALQRLVLPARAGVLHGVLCSDEAVTAVVRAWASGTGGHDLPALTLHEALTVTTLLEHTLRPLAVQLPGCDINHAVANGLAALLGIVDKWDNGTPLLVAEHGVYLRERYLAYRQARLGPGARAVMAGFHRQLSSLGYLEADLVLPVTDFNRRWEQRAGAHPSAVVTVHNGVDPERFPVLETEPDEPVLAWVGRVDPLKDLETLLRAFALVVARRPEARLRLFGPVPDGNEGYARRCADLAQELGVDGAVSFEGPVPHSRTGFETGQVVVLSSISEGLPYSVIEAMMCGRPTVSTDVGGVRECVGSAGLVVPPRDPASLAAACLELLDDAPRRAVLSVEARRRALEMFTLDRFEATYRRLYRSAGTPLREVPSQRTTAPALPERLGVATGSASALSAHHARPA
jgi:polysaccharide biosynthesis protein PelF